MAKSYARRLLETVLREEDMPVDTPPMADKPIDPNTPAPPPPGEEPKEDPVAPIVAGMDSPDKMLPYAEGMGNMLGRYMNEEDTDTFTPQSDDDKKAVGDAASAMNAACESLRRFKK